MLRHYVLTLSGATQRLSDALPTTTPGGPDDLMCVAIHLQAGGANAAALYLGGYGQTLTSAIYGTRVPAAASGTPSAPYILDGPVKPSHVSVLGANGEKLSVLLVTA